GTLLQLKQDGDAYITLQNATDENTDGAAETKIIFEDHANAALAQIQASHDGIADDTKGDLILSTHNGSALTEGMRIDSTQNVSLAGTLTGVTTAITGTKNNALAITIPTQGADDAVGVGMTISADDGGSGGTGNAGGDMLIEPGAASGGNNNGGIFTLRGGALSGSGADGYVRITDGTDTPGNTLDDESLFVKGILEVDGVLYADGGVSGVITPAGDLEMGDTPYSIDGGTSGLTFDPDNDNANEVTISTAGLITSVGLEAGAGTVNATGMDAGEGNIANVGEIAVDKLDDDNGTIAIGDNDETVAVDSSDWDINVTGDMTGIGAITADGNVQLGSATVDSGTLTMIKGAQTGDPQVQFALSGDANGDFTITPDTGSAEVVLAAGEDFIIDEAGADFMAFDRSGSTYTTDATSTAGFTHAADTITTGEGVSISADGLSTGTAAKIESTSTAGGASGTSKALDIVRSGANANTAHTAYGVYSAVTNTNATSGTNIAGYLSASGATTANYGLIVENGNVGIGTTTPGARLQIGDNTNNTSNRIVLGEYDAASQGYLPVIQQKSILSSGASNDLALGATSADAGILFYTGATDATQTLGTNVNDIRMAINKDGQVGIGTDSPGTLLELSSTAPYLTLWNSTEEDTEGGRESQLIFEGEQSGGEQTSLAIIQASHDGTSDDEKGDLIFYVNDGDDGASPTEGMRLDSAGDLTVAGSISGTISGYVKTDGSEILTADWDIGDGRMIQADKIQARDGAGLSLFEDGGTGIFVEDGGEVGIGTATPNNILEVNKQASGAIGGIVQITNNVAVATGNAVSLRMSPTDAPTIRYSEIQAINTDGNNNIDLTFITGSGATITEKVRITASGLVGIGTTSPDTILELAEDSADTIATISTYDDDATESPQLILRKADNTEASPALVDDNDVLGTVFFEGHDGSGWHEGARIEARIDGAASDGTDMPTELSFWTTPDASATAVQAMTIDDEGNVGIGADSPAALLDLDGGEIKLNDGTYTAYYEGEKINSYASIGYTVNGREGLTLETTTAGKHIVLTPASTGNVGIGDTGPDYPLEILSTTTPQFAISHNDTTDHATFDVAADGLLTITTLDTDAAEADICLMPDGNVGIGTATPNRLLYVNGTSGFNGKIYAGSNNMEVGALLNNVDNNNAQVKLTTTGVSLERNIADANPAVTIQQEHASSTGDILQVKNNADTVLTVQQDGDVGIGTTGPDAILDVTEDAANATVNISAFHDTEATTPLLTLRKADNTEASPATIDANAVLGTVNFDGYDDDSFDTGASIYAKADANWSGTERGTALYFQTRDGSGALTDQMTIAADGTVTFAGTVNATSLQDDDGDTMVQVEESADEDIIRFDAGGTEVLNVNSSSVFDLSVQAADVTLADAVDALNFDSNTLSIDAYNNHVGIGTAAPEEKLDVRGDGQFITSKSHTTGTIAGTDGILRLYNNWESDTDEKGAILTFEDNYNDGSYQRTTRAAIKGGTDETGNTADGFLALYTDSSGDNTANERMRIDSNGNVGIGTTSPDTILELAEDSADTIATISTYDDDATESPQLILRKADNTEASPALVDDNDVLGTVFFEGHDGSGWHEGARIEARIDGTASDGTDMPTELSFWTTPDNSATAVQAMTIDDAGNVGIGEKIPDVLLTLAKESADTIACIGTYDDDATELPELTLRKADNTVASPALVDDNDVLGVVSFDGHDGSGWHEGARIEARIDGTPSDGTDMPTELSFWTTPEASATAVQAMTIDDAGQVGIGTESPGTLLDVHKTDTTTNAVVDVVTITEEGGTPAAGLGVGLTFDVEDEGGVEQQGSIDVALTTVTEGSENADMIFSANINGTVTEFMRFNAFGESTRFQGSSADIILKDTSDNDDFEIRFRKSDNTDVWKLGDAGNDRFDFESVDGFNWAFDGGDVGIGTLSPGTPLDVHETDTTTNAVVDVLTLAEEGGTPAAGLGVGLTFDVEDAGEVEEQGSIDVALTNVTDTEEDADMVFSLNSAGAITEIARLNGDAKTFQMPEVAAPSGDPAANAGWLYVKDNGGASDLYFEDDAGTVVELTAAGAETDPTLTDDGAVTMGSAGGNVTLTFDADGGTDGTIVWDGGNDELEILNGEVGIGTTAPDAMVHMHTGAGSFPKMRFSAADVTLPDYSGSSSLSDVDQTNTIGQIREHIDTVGTNDGGLMIQGFTGSAVNDEFPLELVGTHGGSSPTTPAVIISGQRHSGVSNRALLSGAEPVLDVMDGHSNGNVLLRVEGGGEVGIGTDSPGTLLELSSTAPYLTLW
ncbi:beta strand repeat-containing protein, partial [Candidatus Omnitrophota bacterium]